MKFVIDAQLPPALGDWLRNHGHDAEHVAEVSLLSATDVEIAEHCVATAAFLITKDEDFTVLRSPDRFGLLWMRCGNTTKRALFDWLAPRWNEVERLLGAGERFIELR